jgi:hypothetical protein
LRAPRPGGALGRYHEPAFGRPDKAQANICAAKNLAGNKNPVEEIHAKKRHASAAFAMQLGAATVGQ